MASPELALTPPPDDGLGRIQAGLGEEEQPTDALDICARAGEPAKPDVVELSTAAAVRVLNLRRTHAGPPHQATRG